MTREEAIKWLKTFKGSTGMTELSQAFDVAIAALEKQEPKMVIYSGDGYADGEMVYDMAECPTCGAEWDEYEDGQMWLSKFCPECGQALEWEEPA